MKYFIPPEFAIPLVIFGVIAFILRKKKLAAASAALAGFIVFYPLAKDFLLIFMPTWMALLLGIVALLAMLRIVLGALLGEEAASQTVGQLAADAIKFVLFSPFWLFRKLGLGTAAISASQAAVRATSRLLEDATRQRLKEMPSAASESDVSLFCGKVVRLHDAGCIVESADGVQGNLAANPHDHALEVGDIVNCTIVDQQNDGQLQIELVSVQRAPGVGPQADNTGSAGAPGN